MEIKSEGKIMRECQKKKKKRISTKSEKKIDSLCYCALFMKTVWIIYLPVLLLNLFYLIN